jgi:hypothetical protein
MSEKDWLEDEYFPEAELRFGRRPTPEEAGREFALHGVDARVQHLKRLRDSTPKAMTLNEVADRHAYTKVFRGVHERLRKVGR